MTITALPAAPSRADAPETFVAKADAFVAALAVLVTEMNLAIASANQTKWISGTTYAIGDEVWSPTDFQAYRRKTAGAGTTDPSADSTSWQRTEYSASSAQVQSGQAYTTGGASTAYTLTPTPAISGIAPTLDQEWDVTFHAAAGATPTLSVSGTTAKSLKYRDSAGAKKAVTAAQVPVNWRSKVVYDGTDYVLRETPQHVIQIMPITASVGSNALTLTLNPTSLDFRSATLGSGTVNTRAIAAAVSVVVSSGSTLGTVSGQAARLAVLALDNAGTVELAVVNTSGGVNLDETTLISTTAEGGAGAADSKSTIYSTTARSNVAFRVLGFIDITEATAGTWATAPSTIQGAGGLAVAGMASLGAGQTWQSVTRNTGTTYYNTTGKPIVLHREFYGSAQAVKSEIAINGGSNITFLYNSIPSGFCGAVGSIVIPPGASYVVTDTGAVSSVVSWELR